MRSTLPLPGWYTDTFHPIPAVLLTKVPYRLVHCLSQYICLLSYKVHISHAIFLTRHDLRLVALLSHLFLDHQPTVSATGIQTKSMIILLLVSSCIFHLCLSEPRHFLIETEDEGDELERYEKEGLHKFAPLFHQ